MAHRFNVIFFDLDGTLLDSIPGIVASLRHTFKTHLDWSPDDRALISGIGTPLDEQLAHHALNYTGKPLTSDEVVMFRRSYHDHNLATHDATIKAYPGVTESIERLSAAGLRQAIVTSKPQSTARRGLRVCGLESHFDFVIGYDDVVHPKPHPEPVIKALRLADARPEDAVFIGDSPHDILSGRRAGVVTVGAQWGPFEDEQLKSAEPTHLFGEITKLTQWLVE